MASWPSLVLEFLRKSIHLFAGLLIVLGYTIILNFVSEKIAIWSLTFLLLILLEIEYIRLEHRPKIAAMFDVLFRKHERDNLTGAVFYTISCVICFAAFDYWVAVLAMFMTVFGDLAAALMGKAFGKTSVYKTKTYIGTLSGFAANVIAGLLFLPHYYYLVLPMAMTATFVELFTRKLDDNLTVPLFSGFLGQMIVYFFAISLPPVEFSFLGFF